MSLVWNPPPKPPESRLQDALFKGDVQVAAWRQRRGLSGHAHEDPSTLGLSQNALAYILMEIESRRHRDSHLAQHLHTAMVKLTPQLAQPSVSGTVDALAHVFAQPEMQRFWARWESERSAGARGPRPSDAGAKAVLCTLGMTKNTHALAAYSDLLEKPELLRVLARADQAAGTLAGETPGPLRLATYRGSLKRFDALTARARFRELALWTNAELFRGLCELYPDRGFGRRLLIDGCLFPAWTPQVGKGATDEQEAIRRRTTPHAGARLIHYTSKGKHDLDPRTQMSAGAFAGSANFDRGYFYVCILDQASGWPLVSLVMDAAFDEAEALTALLSDLYQYYDFIQPELIAGDGAWDETWAHRACELFYGLAPVFRHTERAAATTTSGNQSNTVRGFTHDGRLVCMSHGREMPFDGFERSPRGDLRPGQGAHGYPDSDEYRRELAQRENQFRVRALHQHGPGPAQRVGLKVAADWRRLNAFPRHPNGKPELYAMRQALGMRLKNQMEGHFNRMQGSLSMMTEDADRLRLQNWDKVEALLHLAELRMNALSLAAERGHLNARQALPPDGEVAPLPEFPFGRNGRLAECRTNGSLTRSRARRRTAPESTHRHAIQSALTAPAPRENPVDSEPTLVPLAVTATGVDDAVRGAATVIQVDFSSRKRR